MSTQLLPAQIAPYKFARQARHLKGFLSLGDMKRLQEALASSNGQIDVDLKFGRDEGGTHFAVGSLHATVEMVCQRCMAAMPVEFSAEVRLGFCTSADKAERIPDSYESCVVEEEPVALVELIEDELILALPLVASHPEQSCQPWLEKNKAELEVVERKIAKERKNPFAALEGFKQQK